MFCTRCGYEMKDEENFCAKCGKPAREGYTEPPRSVRPRLTRSMEDKKIAGVCSGLARYLDIDAVLVRIIFLTFALATGGIGLIAYIVAWILMPRDRPAAGAPAYRPAEQS